MTANRATPSSPAGRRTVSFLLRQPRQSQGFREALAEDLSLTLLWIPPGRFWMGSPPTEEGHQANEAPRHLVQLPGFFLSQTPITQGQWRAVAQWEPREGERWGCQLEANPSRFQPKSESAEKQDRQELFRFLAGEATADQRPVERVGWDDAREFCQRLSQRTGRFYTLPSEAQWEYACRAGSGTAFAFGETLSANLANYKANETYANGPKGEYRKQTTPVGMFPANAWGLHDMHGNVWEWCLDDWHGSYEGAPEDGGAWVGRGEAGSAGSPSQGQPEREPAGPKLLRGGSWDSLHGNCRSAVRINGRPDDASDLVGFRVVCFPQGCSPPAVIAPGATWEVTATWFGGSASISHA